MTTCKHNKHNSWWEYDARGIPLCRVCDKCKAKRLRGYRPDVLRDPQYEADEAIEPEPSVYSDDDLILIECANADDHADSVYSGGDYGYDEGMAQGGDAYVDFMYGDSPDW